MTTAMQTPASKTDYALLLARILMASIFVFSAIEKIFYFNGVVAFASANGVPLARPLMPLAILFELAGGLLLLLGWQCRKVALAFVVWIVVLGVWFHRFWAVPQQEWQEEREGDQAAEQRPAGEEQAPLGRQQ